MLLFGGFRKSQGTTSSEQALEFERFVSAAGICGIASLPLLIAVILMIIWGA